MLLQLTDVTFGYQGQELFEGLTWQVNEGDRVGLVGPNGCGKSTLLRLMTGELTPDGGGAVAKRRGLRIGYLRQALHDRPEETLLEALLEPFSEVVTLREERERLHTELDKGEASRAHDLVEALARADQRWGELGGYAIETRVRELAADVGFADTDFDRRLGSLSGGERGRVELARVIASQPDLLLLDEPTNHLDVDAVERLERRLAGWSGTFVIVSHDRWFLRRTCKEFVDLAGGELDRYAMGYDRYVVEREARLERARAAFERQREEIARTEDFIRRNIAGQKTKQAQSRRKLLARVERLSRPEDIWGEAGRIAARFSVGDHAGAKEAVRAERLDVAPRGAPAAIVRGVDLTVFRGDRIGIIGPNGSGKTTLLTTLVGRLEPRGGLVTIGPNVRIGYYDQRHRDLDDTHSLVDEIRTVRGDLNVDGARAYLARFRFFGDDVFRVVRGLSGGERSRLALAKMMLVPRNLLALDEPTNHLDIPACEVLEDALRAYEGTLLVVSHDRYFLDRVATKILQVDGARAELELGNYSDHKARHTAAATARPPAARPPAARSPAEAPAGRDAAAKGAKPEKTPLATASPKVDPALAREANKDRVKRERRLKKLEDEISAVELQIGKLREELGGEHGGDWQRLHGLVAEQKILEEKLAGLMAEWETLASGV